MGEVHGEVYCTCAGVWVSEVWAVYSVPNLEESSYEVVDGEGEELEVGIGDVRVIMG